MAHSLSTTGRNVNAPLCAVLAAISSGTPIHRTAGGHGPITCPDSLPAGGPAPAAIARETTRGFLTALCQERFRLCYALFLGKV